MAKKPTETVEVLCPCCQARLKIDPALGVVISHEAPPRVAPDVDLNDAGSILTKQAAAREEKFRQSWEAEKKKEDVLSRKFEEALKKAKDQPVEKPLRDFDL
jgi:Zn-finger nucleic acid-binding protein